MCATGYNIWPSGDYANLTCVPFENVCDKAEHCLDGSDEASSTLHTVIVASKILHLLDIKVCQLILFKLFMFHSFMTQL